MSPSALNHLKHINLSVKSAAGVHIPPIPLCSHFHNKLCHRESLTSHYVVCSAILTFDYKYLDFSEFVCEDFLFLFDDNRKNRIFKITTEL